MGNLGMLSEQAEKIVEKQKLQSLMLQKISPFIVCLNAFHTKMGEKESALFLLKGVLDNSETNELSCLQNSNIGIENEKVKANLQDYISMLIQKKRQENTSLQPEITVLKGNTQNLAEKLVPYL